MFRDMSGLQATIGLVQAGLQQTMAGASAAGQQAGENMNNLLKATTERQRIGAEMVTSLARTAASAYTGGAIPAGGGISGGGGGGGSSQQGAKINYFDKMGGAPAGAGGNTSASGTQGAAAAAGVGGVGSSGGGQPSTPPTTYSQNPAALQSVWGDTKSPSEMVTTLVDKAGLGGAASGDSNSGAALESRRAWPTLDADTVLSRIEELRKDPNQFDFGYKGLCPAANFVRNVATLSKSEVAAFARTLYATGVAFLGDRKVSPSPSVRNIDYQRVAATATPSAPPQAEWMVMTGLRDSESWLTAPEGLDAEGVLAVATKEYSEFYTSTGLYSSVTFNSDRSSTAMRNLPLRADGLNHVTIWLKTKSDMVGIMGPVLMLTLVTPLLFDTQNDTVQFTAWATGHESEWQMKTADFEAAYLGATVASIV